MNLKFKLTLLAILITISFTSCSLMEKNKEISVDFFAMDTYMNISATVEEDTGVLEICQTAVFELESKISKTNTSSDVYILNNSDGEIITVSPVTYEILSIALEYSEKTGGKFDPTICAVTDLWAVSSENPKVPNKNEIEKALQTVSFENILLLGDNKVQLLNGANIDLGAIGKGYATDMIVNICKEQGVVNAVISLGGNIYVVGEKDKNTPWNIGITDPDKPTEASIAVKTGENSLVTTGGYQRFFEKDGKIYHHIFDCKTGYPSETDIKSVTVISKNSTLADVYSTALFVMGFEQAIKFSEKENIDVVIIKNNDEVFISEGLSVELGEKYEN